MGFCLFVVNSYAGVISHTQTEKKKKERNSYVEIE